MPSPSAYPRFEPGPRTPDEPFATVEVVDAQGVDAAAPPGADVVVATEVLEDVVVVQEPHLVVRIIRGFFSAVEWCVGGMAIIAALAILAPLPILQFLSLGYLLEVSGRIGRTGRFSAGFVGFRKAARVGTIVLCTFLFMLPLWYVAAVAHDAAHIEPGGLAAERWGAALFFLTAILAVHVISAYWRGGRFRHFLWPMNPLRMVRGLRGRAAVRDPSTAPPGLFGAIADSYAHARDGVWNFVVALRLPYYFWLGTRGFVGGLLWLLVPVTLLAFAGKPPITGGVGALSGFVGAGLLMLTMMYLPFVQARFAAEGRFWAMFELRPTRDVFRRAPVAFGIALFFTLLFALPLYLLKIELVPRDAAGLPSLFFVLSIFPARLLAGWAYARGVRRPNPRHWFFRVGARLWMLPVTGFYVFIVFFTQYTSWHGVWSLYEQHAFLLPVPFLGL